MAFQVLDAHDAHTSLHHFQVLDEILQENLPVLPEKTNDCVNSDEDSEPGGELIDDCNFDARTDVYDSDIYDIFSTRCSAVQVDSPKTYVKTTQTMPGISQGVQTHYSFLSSIDCGTMTHDIKPVMVDCSAQCNLIKVPSTDNKDDEVETNDDGESVTTDDEDDDWYPEDDESVGDGSEFSDTVDEELDITDIQNDDPVSERKYIVFESLLKELFMTCRFCNLPCRVFLKRSVGTMVSIEAVCADGHKFSWNSQPSTNKMPLGNRLLSGSILFSGGSVGTVLNVLNSTNIASFSDRTYRYIQSSYLIPSVNNVWDVWQTAALRECEGRNVKLGGDARYCSPGHTAKYGSYSLMDLETGLVLDVQLVQASEVGNSYAMEKEGLTRGINMLKSRNVRITDLTTDRHTQVRKYIATEHTNIRHWFDVWHVAKAVYKKLVALAKKKGCESVGEWAQSISNHLYWAAATSDGDGELVKQKSQSVANHVANIHTDHGDRFKRCLHGDLVRNWILKDSKPHKELCIILNKTGFLNDIKKLSPAEQTSKLESYHKIVCQFAPKFQHFFYSAMKARLLIAALHNNENCQRCQATNKDGTLKWKLSYPKGKRGDHVLKKVKTDCTYVYRTELLRETLEIRERFPSYREARVLIERDIPRPATASANRVTLDTAITRFRSRFNN